ncbi:hypothetical protein KIW84_UN0348 [Lathyrus oleraceus]|nr:hypothetical protein KIW84_UN0348 [Pisum sativum]
MFSFSVLRSRSILYLSSPLDIKKAELTRWLCFGWALRGLDLLCMELLSYRLRFYRLGHLILWFQHMAMVQIQTKYFLSCLISAGGSRVAIAPDDSK